MVGRDVGHYRIEKELGAGGMGVVYLALDRRLGRHVALKLIGERLSSDPASRERLLREARTASALNHPNICIVHEIGHDAVGDFIVMEHVEGTPLASAIPPDGLPPESVRAWGIQVADGLAHAHERGIVHRDLKSSNVIVTPAGLVKILDFGLARRLPAAMPEKDATRSLAALTEAGVLMGTLPCLPPEALLGEPWSAQGDIWALGVLLYEMASGRLPFSGRTAFELSAAILREPPVPVPERHPVDLRRIVERCLAKAPKDRYPGAEDVKAALEAVSSATVAAGAAEPASSIRSLAVLPLENLSGDPGEDYFADGMTEAITACLAKIRTIRVISRTSAMRYKGARKPLPEIARELGVDAVVEGSVVRAGSRVRITAQLIRAASDEHLWAETYDRDLHDVLELQSDVARAAVEAIRGRLTPEERAGLGAARRVSPAAYEAYLKGRYSWNLRTEAGLKKGIEHFQRAIHEDPTYALAYTGMADCFDVLGFQGGLAPRDSYSKAIAAAQKALEIDDSLAEAHCSLAYAALHLDWDWPTAGRLFRRAIELNPNYATAHHWHALWFAGLGRRDDALAEMERARVLDPLSLIIGTAIGFVLHLFGEHDAAVEEYRKTLDMNPSFWVARLWLANSRAYQGELSEALSELRGILGPSDRHPVVLSGIAYAEARSGKRREARTALEELVAVSRERYRRPYDVAKVHVGLDETEEALAWLERARDEGGNWLNYLAVDPAFDALRGDPRFEALRAEVYASADSERA